MTNCVATAASAVGGQAAAATRGQRQLTSAEKKPSRRATNLGSSRSVDQILLDVSAEVLNALEVAVFADVKASAKAARGMKADRASAPSAESAGAPPRPTVHSGRRGPSVHERSRPRCPER